MPTAAENAAAAVAACRQFEVVLVLNNSNLSRYGQLTD